MKENIKNLYLNSKVIFWLLYYPNKIRKTLNTYINSKLTDEEFIQKKYKDSFGKNADLDNPKTFTEKIQWLKLYDRNKLYTVCADKYMVRDYVREKIGENYLIPLLFATENPKDINSKNMPAAPFIVKTNHDSGGTFIFKDSKELNYAELQKKLSHRMKKNFYSVNREWEYKDIQPKIIVEQFLKDDKGDSQLNDYKIYCFNGEPLYIQTIFDRGVETKETWYDTDWKLVNVHYFSSIKKDVPKPKQLGKLLEVARKLAQDFPYVRVDLYISEGKIYFGELTFRPYGGFMKFEPRSFDLELGEKINLKEMD